MYPKLKKLILQYKPTRIFTHSVDDPVPDHRAVNKILLESLDKMKSSCEVYMFDIWNFLNFKKQNYPKIFVDITQTFKTKIKALRMFESQKIALFSLMWSVYFKAWLNGRKINARYAEVFYKIR
jgi:LmbE family N-acetylglucosaminyl deacetylase